MNRGVPSSEPAVSEPSVLLALGFRPFFLTAGVSAPLLVGLWIGVLQGWLSFTSYYDRLGGLLAWHGHEMLFGFVAAVVAGFLLTAVRNWTGIPTPSGAALGGLLALWLAGRIAPLLSETLPAPLIAALDLAFLPVLAITLGVPLVRRGIGPNLMFVVVLGALTVANLLIHLQALGLTTSTAARGRSLAVDLIVLLMALIGGRVLPMFTRNAVPGAQPRRWPILEVVCLASVAGLAVLRPFSPDLLPAGWVRGLAGIAALAHGVRLWGWHDRGVWSRPLLWVLYVGYGWLVVGFFLTALGPRLGVAPSLALHAFTTGAMGTLTVGMMSRVSLGHTGRPLEAPRSALLAYVTISFAAFVRVVAIGMLPQWTRELLMLAGGLWIAGFLFFVVGYLPILLRPRVDGRPG